MRSRVKPFVFLALLPSCWVASPDAVEVRPFDARGLHGSVLAEQATADGGKTTWAVDDGVLKISRERPREVATLGADVREVKPDEAERLGVAAYSGLFVAALEPGGALAAAGVEPGDVLLRLEGTELMYESQLDHIVSKLQPGGELAVAVRRGRAEPRELALDVVVGARRVVDYDVETVPLPRGQGSPRPVAGVQLLAIPAEHAREIFDEEREVVLINDVTTGSPAYLAGLRGGDLIERIEGAVPAGLHEVEAAIRGLYELGEPLWVEVRRPGGERFENLVELADFTDTANVHVPLLLHVDGSPARTRWRFGPWGLLASYDSVYLGSEERREVEASTAFSCLLGLLKVRSGPDGARVRLGWIIEF